MRSTWSKLTANIIPHRLNARRAAEIRAGFCLGELAANALVRGDSGHAGEVLKSAGKESPLIFRAARRAFLRRMRLTGSDAYGMLDM